VVLIGYVAELWSRSKAPRMPAPPASPQLIELASTPDTLVSAFGAADYDQSSIGADATVTRSVTYAVEYVQVVYRSSGPASTAASRRWTLIGFRDAANFAWLNPTEAMARLSARRR
jgi:hypothetical protein